MKPAQPAATGRTPYAERPDIIERHCTCPAVYDESVSGRKRIRAITTDPDCPLHGDRREPTSF